MDYQAAAICPKCGGNEQVHTARELFDITNEPREQAFQRLEQGQNPSQEPGPGGTNGDDEYDHYNVEGSDPHLRGGRRLKGDGPDFDFDFGDSLPDDIGAAVAAVALGFASRAIGKRVKKVFKERVMPAMEARMGQSLQQSRQQFEQTKVEQDAIVDRYPELRGCVKDQVVFLDGGYRTEPFSELSAITLAKADAVVARLREAGLP